MGKSPLPLGGRRGSVDIIWEDNIKGERKKRKKMKKEER
jgi:hypothetical protein